MYKRMPIELKLFLIISLPIIAWVYYVLVAM